MLVRTRRLTLGDVDSAGIAFTGRLVALAMEVLEEGLSAVGLDFAAILRDGRPILPIVHLDADFRAPIRHGQAYEGHLLAEGVGTTSATCRVELRLEDGRVASAVRFVAACVDPRSFTTVPVPDEYRQALARLS